MSEKENRADFEKWYCWYRDARTTALLSRVSDDRRYESMETEYAWQAWRAAQLAMLADAAAVRNAALDEAADECERMKMFPGGRQEAPAHQGVWAAAKAIRALKQIAAAPAQTAPDSDFYAVSPIEQASRWRDE